MPDDRRVRVTVVVPAVEGGAGAADAVASALAQGSDVEVIVVHDGGARDLVASLAERGDPRVRLLAHPSQGVARALALGAAVASGEWLVALSPRETLLEGALARRLEAATEDCAGVLAPSELVGAPEDGSVVWPSTLAEALLSPVLLPGGGALLRTAAVRAVGSWDASLRFAHHLDLWLRLLAEGALVLESAPAVREPWRGREPGEREPEPSRLERAVAIGNALATLRPRDWFPERRGAPAEAAPPAPLDLARLVARAGLDELLPYADELLAEARAAGAALDAGDPDFAWATAPATPHSPSRARASEGGTWLRLALEVRSLDRGGLESVVADLALGLGSSGIEPVVVCTERGGARADELREVGVEVVVLRARDRAAELGAFLEERAIDVLNPHFSTLGIRPAAARLVPVVPTLHNAYAWVGASSVDEMRALDPLVAGYTAVSRYVADFCARRFAIARERICVIPNAYRGAAPVHGSERGSERGSEELASERAAARAALGVAADTELVLQVGRVDAIKCQLALVDAVAALVRSRPRLVAWIVGASGDDAYRARVVERIDRAGLAERVLLLGERADVDRLLAAADVLAMPSVLEGLSLSVIEALAAGVPAVLTRTGDAGFLLGEGEGECAGALPGALIEGPRIDPVSIDGEELLRIARANHPAHARALAEALARVLDDLPAMRERARLRGATMARDLAPGSILDRYADVFARTAAVFARRRSSARSAEIATLEEARRRREPSLQALRGALASASEGLGATLETMHRHTEALRSTGALSYELATTRRELESTVGVMGRTLDKLRLTNRLREALRALGRRSGPP